MYRVIMLAIIGCIIGVVLKHHCSEFYLPFQIGFAIISLVYVISSTSTALRNFVNIIESLGVGYEIIKVLFKASLITIGTKLGCDICKECGNHLMGDIIELGGKLMIFILTAPYIIDIIKISTAFLE